MRGGVQKVVGAVSGCGFMVVLIVCVNIVKGAPVELPAPGGLCNVENRDPCVTFPDLCSAGGGRCVVKAPCEYQCLCPPDDRVARDCTSNANPQPGTMVDTLLIFPKDIFLDVNHVAKSQHLMDPNLITTTQSTTSGRAAATTWRETASLKEITTPSSKTTTAMLAPGQTLSSGVLPAEPPTIEGTTPPSTTRNIDVGFIHLSHKVASAVSFTSRAESSTSSTKFSTPGPGQHSEVKNVSSIGAPQATTTSVPSLPARTADSHSLPEETTTPTSMAGGKSEQQLVASDKQGAAYTEGLHPTASASAQTTNSKPKELGHASHHMGPTHIHSVDLRQPQNVTPQSPTATTSNLQRVTSRGISSSHVDVPTTLSSSDPSQSSTTPNLQTTTSSQTSDTTSQPHLMTITTTSQQFSPSPSNGGASSPSYSNHSNSAPHTQGAEEFPTLFKVTLGNSLSQSEVGVNSPLSRVVHRVFVPREQFETIMWTGPR